MPENGFVPLSRKLFRNFLWKEERELSRFEAWLDMIQQAKFATETAMVEGRCLSVRRGDLVASVRYLAQRWRWSRSRVERFLNLLKEQAMIETRTETGVNVITLCNYEAYNNPRDTDGTATRTVAGQSRDTPATNITRRRRKEGEEEEPPKPPKGGGFGHPGMRVPEQKATKIRPEQMTEGMRMLSAVFFPSGERVMTVYEARAYYRIKPSETDVRKIVSFYALRSKARADEPNLWKSDLCTLLNQWQEQLDRAEVKLAKGRSGSPPLAGGANEPKPIPEPSCDWQTLATKSGHFPSKDFAGLRWEGLYDYVQKQIVTICEIAKGRN